MRSKDKQLEQLVLDFATDYADAKVKYKETLAKVQVYCTNLVSSISSDILVDNNRSH
jgi:hypothetical protein